MNDQRPSHRTSLLIGAALLAAGYLAGSLHSDHAVSAQTVVSGQARFFVSGGPAIVTASNDGKTLHFWSMSLTPEVLNPTNRPQYVGKVDAK